MFDLDGTLTESGEGITKSVQYALERIGKPEPNLEKLKVFIGPPLMEMFMQYAQIDEAIAKQAVEIYRERYSVTGIFENAVYPGIENMLAQLEKKGYILAVASSKPEVYVRQILDHFGLTRYFTEIGGSELNGRRTNKTEVIEDVLKRLNMDKHRDQVIMVGDKEHDVYGARKAGLECIAVSFGYGTEEELKQAEPLKIVDSAEGIVDFFRLSPLRKQNIVSKIWRAGYPAGIHFVISQIVAGTALAVFARTAENSAETYYNYTIFLTGLTGILAHDSRSFVIFDRNEINVRRIAGGSDPGTEKSTAFLTGNNSSASGRSRTCTVWKFPDGNSSVIYQQQCLPGKHDQNYRRKITSYDDFLDGNYCTCGGGNDLPLVNLSASA
mgnify:CR=1 FL=1